VFEPESPFQRFQRLDDSTATGPGVIDMKGGDVIALLALRALRDNGVLDRLHVVVVFDGDEERPGARSRPRARISCPRQRVRPPRSASRTVTAMPTT